jgi:hypothetical protein
LVEAAGKGVTGCRIAKQNLQVRIAVFAAWAQCGLVFQAEWVLRFQAECELVFQAEWVLRFQASKWENVEQNNGGYSKGVSRTDAFIFRGPRH